MGGQGPMSLEKPLGACALILLFLSPVNQTGDLSNWNLADPYSIGNEVSRSTPPTVDAGLDQVTPSAPGRSNLSATLNGTAPDPDSAFSTEWTMISGPKPMTFGDPFSLQTTVDFPKLGEYVLELSATDEGATRQSRSE